MVTPKSTKFVTEFDDFIGEASKILSHDVLLVVGPTKSGKSTLAAMIGTHDQIRFLSECHFPNQLLPQIRSMRESYNAYVEEKRQAAETDLPAPLLDERFERFAFASAMASAVHSACGNDDVRFIGDTTPNNIEQLPLLLEIFGRARILHIVRDGRDAGLAACKYVERRYPKRFPSTFGDRDSYLRFYAKRWRNYVIRTRDIGAQHAGRYLEVHYETLFREPKSVLRRIFDWLKLDHGEADIVECLRAGPFEPLKNGWWFRESRGHPHHSGWKPGIWKTELTSDQKAAFLKNAAPLLDADGLVYPPPSIPKRRILFMGVGPKKPVDSKT